MRTAYKCRAYPDQEQASAYLTAMKATEELAWLKEVSSVPLQQAIRHQQADLGIRDFAVTSDGQRIANSRHLERRARNLARYQRRLARCQPASANRAKARAKVARAHRKVRAARTDLLHKASTGLVRGWGTFRCMLGYKAARAGRQLIVIDRWYPSSKTCSACGHLLTELSLSTQMWQCPSCGTRHDRDINAAKNILADVRHPGPPGCSRL